MLRTGAKRSAFALGYGRRQVLIDGDLVPQAAKCFANSIVSQCR